MTLQKSSNLWLRFYTRMNFLSDKIKVTWDTRIYSQFVFQHVLKNARHRSIVVLLRLLFYDFLIRYLTWAIKWIKHFRSILIETIVITNIQTQRAILISRAEIQADVIIHFDFKAILISILITRISNMSMICFLCWFIWIQILLEFI